MTLHRTSFAADIAILRQIVDERQVQILVVGLPYTMKGELGPQARRTQKLAYRIAQALDLPLHYVDERLTSHEAEGLIRSQGLNPSEHRDLIDRKAAALILQQWLDQKLWQSSRGNE
jgi:putative Holliday junction resolvase